MFETPIGVDLPCTSKFKLLHSGTVYGGHWCSEYHDLDV